MIDISPETNSHNGHVPLSQAQEDANARHYIHALQGGEKPATVPQVGKWLSCCTTLQGAYDANPDAFGGVLKSFINGKVFPGLRELLSEDEPIQASCENAIPALPETAYLPAQYLPKPCDDPLVDWYEEWDSLPLQRIAPWLADYLAYSNKKSPEGYVDMHIASALWALSTVAARRIFVPLADPVYTPLAIMLVARTSLFAKTKTAQAAVKVIKKAELGWLLGDDETTPQKLLSDMSGKIPTNYEDMDNEQKTAIERKLGMAGQRGWAYDEFNQLIDAMTRPGPMAEFAGLLRKLDDCHDEYKYSTRTHGQEIIEKPYVPLLANTTPANLRKHAAKNSEFWNDGFWARFATVTPPQHAWKTKTMQLEIVEVPDSLARGLHHWNTQLGEPQCMIVENANQKTGKVTSYSLERGELPQHTVYFNQDAYDGYVRYREALRAMIAENTNHDLDGSYVRLSDKALRFAALIASLENENRITFAIWTLAQELAEMFRRNLHELYAQVSSGQMDDDPMENTLIDFFKAQPQQKAVTVREICQFGPLHIRKLKAKTIRELLGGLEHDGIIECVKSGKKEMYSMVRQGQEK